MFAQRRAARHKDDRLGKAGCGQHGADPGMADNQARLLHQPFKLRRRDFGLRIHMLRGVAALAGLRDHWQAQRRRKRVHRCDQAIKPQLHPDGDKDHSTAPK